MDSDIDGEVGLPSRGLEAADEGAGCGGEGERDGFGGGGGYVVACFGEEECLGDESLRC